MRFTFLRSIEGFWVLWIALSGLTSCRWSDEIRTSNRRLSNPEVGVVDSLETHGPYLPKSDPPSSGILETLLDFENETLGGYRYGYIWHFAWDEGIPGRDLSAFDIIQEPDRENRVLRMWVSNDLPMAISSFSSPRSLANLNSVVGGFMLARYLRPEVDAVRIKVKMEQGKIGISFGSPVSQIGNSDVLTAVKYLSPRDMADCTALNDGWYQCDFDFNENLIRNNRRANFSADSNGTVKNRDGKEIIYYSRWVQEQMRIYIVPYDSNGNRIISDSPLGFNTGYESPQPGPVVWFDDFQLVNKGKGQPFREFDTSARPKQLVDDFNQSVNSAFTVDFGFPTRQPVPLIRHESDPLTGDRFLQIEGRTFEESAWTGISAANGDGFNAVSFKMRVNYEANDGDQFNLIDFIALANREGSAFDWNGFSDATGVYHYVLSKLKILDPASPSRDLAFYHARRIVKRNDSENKWQTIVIPFADFVAFFGNGEVFKSHQQDQRPLSGSEISVVGLQTTFNQARASTVIQVDQVEFISLPGTNAELRSYWQGFTTDE